VSLSSLFTTINQKLSVKKTNSLSELKGQILVRVLLHDLSHRQFKVFLSHMNSTLTEREHTSLSADRLGLGATCARHQLGDFREVDSTHQVHFTAVNAENVDTSLVVGVGEFNFAIDSTRSQQRIIQDVDSVSSHDDLDLLSSLKPVKLVEQLEHSPLHFGVTTSSRHSLASNRINLVHEDDRGGVGARHNEQLSDHSGAFTDVLLNQLSRLHFNELTVSVMGYSSGQESLSGAGGSVKEDTLRLGNSKSVEDLGMLDRKLNDLLHLLDLLVKPSNHVISGVGHFFDLHEVHQRVYLRW